MDVKLFVINLLYTILDLVIGLAGVALFGWSAYVFGKWWLCLFALIPLALYSNHALIITEDLEAAAKKGGESDS